MSEAGARLFEELMRFRPEGLTANAWAVKAGVSRTIWSDLKRHGNPSRRTLSKLLEAAGSSLAEFEALRVGAPSQMVAAGAGLAEHRQEWRQPLPPLPLYRSEQRGTWGTWGTPDRDIPLIAIDLDLVVDRLPRPPSLAPDREAYAVTIIGESMWPRFRPGRRIAVAPTAAVTRGDDVLLILAGHRGALIGELRSQAPDELTLRQFNPMVEFDVPAADVAAVHKILGELI